MAAVVNGCVSEMPTYAGRTRHLSMQSTAGDICWVLMVSLVLTGVVCCILCRVREPENP